MVTSKRIESIDVFRGMAVLGFIIWHAFDLFYSGNQFDTKLFRSVILTRVAFIMVSAMVLGFREWNGYRIRDHFPRSLKIMIYPITIGIGKAIYQKSTSPIIEILIYPFWGSGNFTFSILIAIGCIYCLLPLFLKNSYGKNVGVSIATVLVFLEFAKYISLPEFWQFFCISLCCANIGSYIKRFSTKQDFINVGMLILGIGVFYLLIVYPDIYWTIRNYTVLQILLLMISIVGFAGNIYLWQEKLPISSFFMILGQNSFFIYIGHYVLYVIIAWSIGLHQLSLIKIIFIVMMCSGLFVTISILFKNEIIVINKMFF